MSLSIIIKNITEELLAKMDITGQVNIDETDPANLVVNIETDEAGFLIGQAGSHLQSFQHLVRVLTGKKYHPEPSGLEPQLFQFTVDVNSYKKNRENLLKELALSTAEQVLRDNSPLLLQPMVAYERRIIHLALINHPKVLTESTGQEPTRRILIKPKF